jgi:serine/threonine-protein kinase
VEKPQQKQKKKALGPVGKAARTALPCITLACTGPQVRPMPPAEECPPGAAEAMAARGFKNDWRYNSVRHAGPADQMRVTVKDGSWSIHGPPPLKDEGPGFTVVTDEGGHEYGLSGRFFFCGERVCGRFTEAQTEEGETFPVCLELWQEGMRGMARESGSTEDSAKITVLSHVKPVKRFE